MKSNKRNGISLIVLVITIIIMIILAGAIILSLSGSGIITNANKGSFQSDIKTMQEELNVYIGNMQLKDRNKYKKEELYADKTMLQENGARVEGKTILNILKSMDKKYLDKVQIVRGKLIYIGDKLKEIAWSNEILLGIKGKELKEETSKEKIISLKKSANIDLVNYKIYGNSVQKVLPEEYQQVEYIESTGTQYISTGYLPNFTTRVIADYQYTQIKNSYLFGSSVYNPNSAYYVRMLPSGGIDGYGTKAASYNKGVNTERHIIDKNRNKTYLDGELLATHSEYMFYNSVDIEIFSHHSGSTNGASPTYAKLYSFKIYDRNVLVREYIPCYRKADNEIGLYDVINNKFYTNRGEGTFVKGADVNQDIKIQSVGDLVEEGENKGKYVIPVKVKGKNIYDLKTYYAKWLNDQRGITYNNDDFHTIYWHLGTKVMGGRFKENTQYVWSFDYNVTTDSAYNYINLVVKYTDGTSTGGKRFGTLVDKEGVNVVTGHATVVSDVNKTISEVALSFGTASNMCNVELTNMMVEEGTKESRYEPYKEEIYNIYLNEPLRKVGNYVDYIDFRKQEVVRNVEEVNGELRGLSTPRIEKISLPSISLNDNISTIEINTMLSPSKIDTIYYTK